jgi:hypothetical protein
MPLPTSALITRKQLACLTGGNVNGVQQRNILKVGTPVQYCGGRAIAIKNGTIHHVCLKEGRNHPMPESVEEEFLIYKEPEDAVKDAALSALKQAASNNSTIPIFWEPKLQKGKNCVHGMSAKGVMYIGHWTVTEVEDLTENLIKILDRPRNALVHLEFNCYSHYWSNIIDNACRLSCQEIGSVDFSVLNEFEMKIDEPIPAISAELTMPVVPFIDFKSIAENDGMLNSSNAESKLPINDTKNDSVPDLISSRVGEVQFSKCDHTQIFLMWLS